jgi:hypothetical protein
MDQMIEATSLDDVGVVVEAEKEVEKAGEENVAHEAEVDLQVKMAFRISNLFFCHLSYSIHTKGNNSFVPTPLVFITCYI